MYYTIGDIGFVTFSRVQTREQMNNLLKQIGSVGGVNETSSRFVMDEHNAARRMIEKTSDAVVDNVIDS